MLFRINNSIFPASSIFRMTIDIDALHEPNIYLTILINGKHIRSYRPPQLINEAELNDVFAGIKIDVTAEN